MRNKLIQCALLHTAHLKKIDRSSAYFILAECAAFHISLSNELLNNCEAPLTVSAVSVSWVSTVWSRCSCGRGFRERRVSCQQVQVSGSVRVLSSSACEGSRRPEDREECSSHACVEWLTGPWGKVRLLPHLHLF